MLDYLLFLFYQLFKIMVLLIPKFIMKYILLGFARLIYLFNIEHKRYAKANLDFIYEDTLNNKEKYKIIYESYVNLVFNLYEFLENQHLDLNQLEKKIEVINEDIIKDALSTKRDLICITAHYGNWEYFTSYIALKYKAITVVGRKMNNKYFNDELINIREKHNSVMLEKSNSAKGLVQALKSNRAIGLVIDQHFDPKKGKIVKFLGKDAPQTDSSSRLAVKFNGLILPLFFERIDFRKYKLVVYPYIDPQKIDAKSEDLIQILSQMQADVMSKQILKNPNDWFWQHRRFKEFNKDIYKKE